MVKRRVVLTLLMLTAMAAGACGNSANTDTICGAQLCVSDVRMVRVDAATVALILEVTEPDGSLNAEDPPAFADGLHITITADSSEDHILDRDFGAGEFSCVAGTTIPGAEGRLTAACIVPLGSADLTNPPPANSEVTLTLYSETFPTALMEVRFP